MSNFQWGLIIACKWVFDVRFRWIVQTKGTLMSKKIHRSQIRRSALSVIDAYDQFFWAPAKLEPGKFEPGPTLSLLNSPSLFQPKRWALALAYASMGLRLSQGRSLTSTILPARSARPSSPSLGSFHLQLVAMDSDHNELKLLSLRVPPLISFVKRNMFIIYPTGTKPGILTKSPSRWVLVSGSGLDIFDCTLRLKN